VFLLKTIDKLGFLRKLKKEYIRSLFAISSKTPAKVLSCDRVVKELWLFC